VETVRRANVAVILWSGLTPNRRYPVSISLFVRQLRFIDLDLAELDRLILRARDEDLGPVGLIDPPPGVAGDVSSSLLVGCSAGEWQLVAREPLVVAGLDLVGRILRVYEVEGAFIPKVTDGDRVERGQVLGILWATPTTLLPAERVILNFLQMLSGIATLTARYVKALGSTPTRLLDTRKTPPGFRYLAKWAFACGGGYNHRFGLWDRVMLKDNHLAVDGGDAGDGLRERVRTAKERFAELPLEVEVDRLDQIEPTIEGGADVVLLDNFPDRDLESAVEMVSGRCLTEASGGILLERLPRIAGMGLDFVSTGAPIHQAVWVDIGMDREGGS